MKITRKLTQILGLNRTILALSFARMADAMGNSLLFILIPLYVAALPKEYIHFSVPVLVGVLIAVYGLVNSFCQPLMGALSDKINRRKLLILIGLGLIGSGTFCFTFADNYTELLILRTLQGVGVALTIPASLSIITSVTKQETRGGSMGVFSTSRMIGFAIGPLLGGFLHEHYGFDTAFYVGSGLIFLSLIFVSLWVKEVRLETPPGQAKKRFAIFDPSLYNSGILTAALATFTMAGCFSMVTSLENNFNERLDITALGFGFAFSMVMVGRLLFQLPLGHFSDRFGRRPFIFWGLILIAGSTILLGEVDTYWELIVLRLIQGVAAAGIAAPAFALAADLSSKGGEGRQMSVITVGFGLGIALGPLISGLLVNYFFELPFLVIGVGTLVSALVIYRHMPETVKKRKATA
uniref:MFS transporter n=1 Tax=Roseihalotalea indica TaxID=2867963 RepID=A0AA49JFH8_9BACT|nr:MFS transporter [Tunicatimonas sp. TK19036]